MLCYRACNQSNQICGCFFVCFFFFEVVLLTVEKEFHAAILSANFSLVPICVLYTISGFIPSCWPRDATHRAKEWFALSEFLFSLSVSTLLLLSIMRQKHHHPFIPVWNIQQLGRVMPHSKVCYSIGLSALSYAITDSLSFWSICFVTQPLKRTLLVITPSVPRSHFTQISWNHVLFPQLFLTGWQHFNLLTYWVTKCILPACTF